MENNAASLDPVTDLCKRLDLLRLRYNIAFMVGPSSVASPPFIPMAEHIVHGLATYEPDAVTVARAIIDTADYMPVSDDTAVFYGSPLGRLFFAAGGFPGDGITHNIAAALLGCSRQWVHTLVRTGRLRSETNGERLRKVNAIDVRDMVRAKIDHHGYAVDEPVN